MSDEIKNKFRDFEAEASDEHIGQRWQAIRPYLPQKRRPVGFFFPRLRGRGLLVAAALVACFSTVAYLVFNTPTPVTAEVSSPVLPQTGFPAAKMPASDSKPTGGHTKENAAPEAEPAAAGRKPLTRTAEETPITPPAITKTLPPVLREELPVAPPAGDMVTHQPPVSETIPMSIQPETNTSGDQVLLTTTDYLPPQQWKPEGNKKELSGHGIKDAAPQRRKPGCKPSLEVFGGLNRYPHVVANERRTGYGYVTGIAIHMRLSRKFFVPVQGIYAGPQKMVETHQVSYTRIVNTITGSTTTLDSSYQFQKLTHVTKLRSERNIQLAIGLGYRLLAAPRFTLSALAMAEVSSSRLKTRRSVIYENGVETADPGTPAPASYAFNNASLASQGPTADNKRRSYAIVPGLHLSYRLNRHWSVTGRVIYHYYGSPIRADMIRTSETPVKSNNMNICLGLSYR